MKPVGIGLLSSVIVAVALLAPSNSPSAGAYPKNPWTFPGNFQNPSPSYAVLEWNRTEYGMPWAWLVHDSCTSEGWWQVRIAELYLLFHLAVAAMIGLGKGFVQRSKAIVNGINSVGRRS